MGVEAVGERIGPHHDRGRGARIRLRAAGGALGPPCQERLVGEGGRVPFDSDPRGLLADRGQARCAEGTVDKSRNPRGDPRQQGQPPHRVMGGWTDPALVVVVQELGLDRKSTRLNSSHVAISYAVFCWKKKNRKEGILIT